MTEILAEIAEERGRQDAKWGRSFPGRPHVCWLAILSEEVGEAARAILEGDRANLREELVQVAAVAASWLEFGEFDRDVPDTTRELDWPTALKHLDSVESVYREMLHTPGVNVVPVLSFVVGGLRDRFGRGERTAELHGAIMDLE